MSFAFIMYLYTRIFSFKTGKDIGEPRVDFLSQQIKSGSIKFLQTEYYYLTIFVLSLAAILGDVAD